MTDRPKAHSRVLILIAGLDIGGLHGGAERYGLNLARCLKDQFNVEICAFWQCGSPAELAWLERMQSEGLHVFFAAPWKGRWNLRGVLQELRILLHCEPYDLVHSHFQVGTLAALTLKWSGHARSALRTAHVTREWGRGLLSAVLRRMLNGWLFPAALDAETGVAQAVVDMLDARPGARILRRKARLTPNGIDPAAFAGLPETGRGHAGRVRIGAAGRLTAQKDFATLLRAFARLRRRRNDVELVIAGEGEEREVLLALAAELGLGDAFRLAGQVGDMPAFYRSLDLFVLPSRWEGLPTVALEAMAAGVAVIATDIPGTREIVEAGWLAPVGDVELLEEKMVWALAHPQEMRRAVEDAYSRAKQYSFEATAALFVRTYQELLGR